MAQEIKIISCPQCGSTSQKQIGTNQYRCNNCQSEYFLNNDDININVKYINDPVAKTPTKKQKQLVFGIVALVLGIIVFMISFLIKSAHNNGNPSASINYLFEGIAGFEAATDHAPIAVMIGVKNNLNTDNKNDNVYAVFYDLTNSKEIKPKKINLSIDGTRGADYRLKTFANGDLYAILGGTNLYKINKTTLSLVSLAPLLLSFDMLKMGIAKVEFVPDPNGGCKILSNDGKTCYYYPNANKLYSQEEFEKINQSKSIYPNSKEDSCFTFPYLDGIEKVGRLPLIKIKYRRNLDGPTNLPTIWFSQIPALFTHSPIPMDEDSNIISYTDFTPGRNYFDAEVLLSNNDEVIIKFKPDLNPNTPVVVQSLNAVTAGINWSYTLKGHGIDPSDTQYVQDIVKTSANYILDIRNQELILLGKDGRFINMLKKYRD